MKPQKKIFTTIASLTAITTLAVTMPFIASCGCSNGQGGGGGGGGGGTLYSININEEIEGGSVIEVHGKTQAHYRELLEFSIIPVAGYSNLTLQLNEETINVMGITTYKISMPKRDLNVDARFLSDDYIVFDLYAGYTPPGEPENWFLDDQGNRVRRKLFIAPKGLTFEEMTYWFPPVPTSGNPNYIFYGWCWWDKSVKDYELGDPVNPEEEFTTNPTILVASYGPKEEPGEDLFELASKQSKSQRHYQQFPLYIKYYPDRVGASQEPKLFKTAGLDPENYIYCDYFRDYKTGKQSRWNIGLYEKNTYQCIIDPADASKGGTEVQFSFMFAPYDTDADVLMNVHFVVTLNGKTYSQTIEDVRVIKDLYGVQIILN